MLTCSNVLKAAIKDKKDQRHIYRPLSARWSSVLSIDLRWSLRSPVVSAEETNPRKETIAMTVQRSAGDQGSKSKTNRQLM